MRASLCALRQAQCFGRTPLVQVAFFTTKAGDQSWIKDIAGSELERLQSDKQRKQERDLFFRQNEKKSDDEEEEEAAPEGEEEKELAERFEEDEEQEEDKDDDINSMISHVRGYLETEYSRLTDMAAEINAHNDKELRRKKRNADYWARRDALAKAVKDKRNARWTTKRDLVYNSHLKVKLEPQGIPAEHLALCQQALDEYASALGHNPSWCLDQKRKAMETFVQFFKRASTSPPFAYNMFTDLNHKPKWYQSALDKHSSDKNKTLSNRK